MLIAKSELIYETDSGSVSGHLSTDKAAKKTGNIYKQFREVDDVIMEHLRDLKFEHTQRSEGCENLLKAPR
ncbi:hypothetical protein HDU97_000192 [Phlyctochytrium planicorne]|nr:hypothetical protein HDU97_000192 [Phlyctochytrium planicorne]